MSVRVLALLQACVILFSYGDVSSLLLLPGQIASRSNSCCPNGCTCDPEEGQAGTAVGCQVRATHCSDSAALHFAIHLRDAINLVSLPGYQTFPQKREYVTPTDPFPKGGFSSSVFHPPRA